jgi:hypothetical protein
MLGASVADSPSYLRVALNVNMLARSPRHSKRIRTVRDMLYTVFVELCK